MKISRSGIPSVFIGRQEPTVKPEPKEKATSVTRVGKHAIDNILKPRDKSEYQQLKLWETTQQKVDSFNTAQRVNKNGAGIRLSPVEYPLILILCDTPRLSAGLRPRGVSAFPHHHIFLRYCPPTSKRASVICPRVHTLAASISALNRFRF